MPTSCVPAFLASVSTLDEAALALEYGAEIIDLKDPARGALGAWGMRGIHDAVQQLSDRCLVSATVGDSPMTPESLLARVRATADAGVNFVKVGLFEAPHVCAWTPALKDAGRGHVSLVAVLFADLYPVCAALPALRGMKLAGIMLDTARKDGRSLRDAMSDGEIASFVAAAKETGLFVGLAGALTLADIAPLAALGPDLLGFRSALCTKSQRTRSLDPARVGKAAALIEAARAASHVSKERQATLTAGAMLPAE